MEEKKKNIEKIKELKEPLTTKDFFKLSSMPRGIYDFTDYNTFAALESVGASATRIFDLDRLLAKDKMREKDGFPRKIRLGKLVKPSSDGKNKIIVVPTASEEKFYHQNNDPRMGEGPSTGGSGEEGEGEVIGEEPLREGEGEGQGAGQGKGGEHSMGTDSYDIGKVLTEQFELPNIKDKGKKTSLTKYTYDLTDKNRGHGQILDKKATLKRLVSTNLSLGYINAKDRIDTSKMILSPGDRMFKILSKEKDYESQAIVFFVRDYSGSMHGKPTEAVVTQHVYINSWLVYQYNRQVISRFILHDTEAVEVPDFYTYYNKNVAGGTEVTAAYKLVNKIIEEENLASQYNIYVFHGTDGDDWDNEGVNTMAQLKILLQHTNRMGITVAENTYSRRGESTMERYLKKSGILDNEREKLHFDSFRADEADESRLIKSIKELIS
ncbi:MAG: hypothetical protein SCALA702_31250 [Melioribacteraceae bacterium]|nr:MAG: hypothetical protein SCALA702_31250 [Melioribacteraceae bacterium]